jgi:alkanesulfonate monooxygenase SsuD/methylene tetrahydromethanopterin reductase-like flavin-dependent oxidoreductase (luciferase family)
MAAEIAEGWQPLFFHPDRAGLVWGDALAEGKAKRSADLGPLDVVVSVPFAFTDAPETLLERHRAQLALYIGGMGARGRNFSNDVARRYGYVKEAALIQDLYLSGRKAEAAAAVPDDLIRDTALVGPAGYVKERLAAYVAAGVTTLLVTPMAATHGERVRAVADLRTLVEGS